MCSTDWFMAIKLVTNPDLSVIYSTLSFKERPFVRKSKVVTQQQK